MPGNRGDSSSDDGTISRRMGRGMAAFFVGNPEEQQLRTVYSRREPAQGESVANVRARARRGGRATSASFRTPGGSDSDDTEDAALAPGGSVPPPRGDAPPPYTPVDPSGNTLEMGAVTMFDDEARYGEMQIPREVTHSRRPPNRQRARPSALAGANAAGDGGESNPRGEVDEETERRREARRQERRERAMDNNSAKQAPVLPPDRFPIFIVIMTIIDVGLFAYEVYFNGGFEPFATNPMYGPSGATLLTLGAKYGPYILDKGEWWRFFSPIVLHVGVIHLALNMTTQLKVGVDLEKSFGWPRIAPIYIISGVGGNMFSVIFLPEQIQVGASGALYGILGTCVIDLIKSWKTIPNPRKAAFSLGIQMAISFALGLLPFIDNFAHIGGFITGLFVSVIMLPSLHIGKWSPKNRIKSIVVATIGLAIWLVGGFAFFYGRHDAAAWCPYCKYLDCVILCDQYGASAPPPPPPS